MYIERISDKYFRKISDFECEEESMEEFLKSEAYKYDLEGEGNTYLFIYLLMIIMLFWDIIHSNVTQYKCFMKRIGIIKIKFIHVWK